MLLLALAPNIARLVFPASRYTLLDFNAAHAARSPRIWNHARGQLTGIQRARVDLGGIMLGGSERTVSRRNDVGCVVCIAGPCTLGVESFAVLAVEVSVFMFALASDVAGFTVATAARALVDSHPATDAGIGGRWRHSIGC